MTLHIESRIRALEKACVKECEPRNPYPKPRGTRFSREDVKAIKAEVEDIDARLSALRDHIQKANLGHTKASFWHGDVQAAADGVGRTLHAIKRLLYRESERYGWEV